MVDFEFLVTFDDEWDCFVAEIWHDNILLAMVTECEKIHLFNESIKKDVIISEKFKNAISYAVRRLKNKFIQ